MTLTVGQELWYVPSNNRWDKPKAVTVKKVGRKWAEIDWNRRIDINTLYVDGGQYASPGRCYLSQEEHEEEVALSSAWSAFRRSVERMYGTPPEGATIETIEQARKLLGIKEDKGNA